MHRMWKGPGNQFTQQVAVDDGEVGSPCRSGTRGKPWKARVAVYLAVYIGGASSDLVLMLWTWVKTVVVLYPGPCRNTENGLVTLGKILLCAESAALILGRKIMFVHYQILCSKFFTVWNAVRCFFVTHINVTEWHSPHALLCKIVCDAKQWCKS